LNLNKTGELYGEQIKVEIWLRGIGYSEVLTTRGLKFSGSLYYAHGALVD